MKRCWTIAIAVALPWAAQAGDTHVAMAWLALQSAAHTCCQVDAHCRTLGVGALACGGPQQYLAWSVLGTHEPTLNATAARYAQARQKQIVRTGEMSVCVLQDDPGASCQRAAGAASGVCTLRAAVAGGQLR